MHLTTEPQNMQKLTELEGGTNDLTACVISFHRRTEKLERRSKKK